ncbi:MAG TPA: hypothetical protein VK563_01655 [Puia sp.]|nr:hypothetical protein [Puia sp.]
MADNPPYPLKNWQHRQLVAFSRMAAFFLIVLFLSHRSLAGEDPDPPYEEILIFMNVQGVGGVQIPAAIRNDVAYLAVTDVLDYLKIKNSPSAGMDSISGFFMIQQSLFVIDQVHNRIVFQGKKTDLPPDAIIRTATNLYLRSDYFGLVFGLNCKFNFRTLSVVLTTNLELPVIREIRQEAMRNNLNRLKGEAKVDTTIQRSYPLFRLGMVDWAVVATQGAQEGLAEQRDNRLNLALGGVVAGGETDVSLNYDNNTPFAGRDQFYQWRHVDNDNPGLRQVTAGNIYSPSISSIYSPVIGLQFTNSPTTYRRSFGSYTLTYYAEANWVTELYVNNTLVNYAKAATTGYYTFQVPLVYGNSVVKLRFYGPYGEERSHEQNIQIPFNFLPVHEFEYSASAGVVQDTINSRFGRINGNYGLNERLTVGGGFEFLSSIARGKYIPFVNASYRLNSNLLLSGEYSYGVRTKFVASYHLPSDLQLELLYIRYKRGQQAINNLYLEERKAILSFPFRSRKFTVFSRLSLYEVILPNTKLISAARYTTVEGLLSGVFLGVNTNLTTYAWFTQQSAPYIYSNLSMAFRMPGKIILTPQVQYEYSQHKIIDLRVEMGKYLDSRGFLNVFYEKNYKSNFQSIGIGLRYDFSFAVSGLSITHVNNTTAMVQSASGSMMYDNRTNYLGYNKRSSVGKGGIIIRPYLDLNGNGRRDKGEARVSGLNVRINGGSVVINPEDSSVRVSDLEAYVSYILRLDASFENVAWYIRNKTIRIIIDPNQFKILDVPVAIAGEVTGSVYLRENSGPDRKDNGRLQDSAKSQDSAKAQADIKPRDHLKPQDRIIVGIYASSDTTLVGQSTTEADGSFDFSGLAPGSYIAHINPAQMRKLNMISVPYSLPFIILPNKDGDVVSGLKFIVEYVHDNAPGHGNP